MYLKLVLIVFIKIRYVDINALMSFILKFFYNSFFDFFETLILLEVYNGPGQDVVGHTHASLRAAPAPIAPGIKLRLMKI